MAMGHKATDTELAYTPVSQAYGYRYKSLSALFCLAALQRNTMQCKAMEEGGTFL